MLLPIVIGLSKGKENVVFHNLCYIVQSNSQCFLVACRSKPVSDDVTQINFIYKNQIV